MTNPNHDSDLTERLANALTGRRAGPQALDRIRGGIRRRRALRWSGLGTLATAVIVTLVFIFTGNTTGDRQTILLPVGESTTPTGTPKQSLEQPQDLFAWFDGDLLIYRINGGSAERVRVLKAPAGVAYGDPVIGPSGKYVYFSAHTADAGSFKLMRVSLDVGDPTEIPIDLPGGLIFSGYLAPSADDSSIAFSASDPTRFQVGYYDVLLVHSLNGGRTEILATNERAAGWLPNSRELISYTHFDGTTRPLVIKRYDVTASTSTQVATLPAPNSCASYVAAAVNSKGQVAAVSGNPGTGGAECSGLFPSSFVDAETGQVRAGPNVQALYNQIAFSLRALPSDDFVAPYTSPLCVPNNKLIRISNAAATPLTSDIPLGTC